MLLWTFIRKFLCGHVFTSLIYSLKWNCWITWQLYVSVLRNCQTVSRSDCTSLHSCQQCLNIPVSPLPCQHFLKKILVILLSVKWYPIILICIFQMTDDVEHLFMCLSGIVYFRRNVYSNPLLHFLKNYLLAFLLLSFKILLHVLNTRLLSDTWIANIFFHSGLMVSFDAQISFIFDKVQFVLFFPLAVCVFVVIPKKPYLTQGHKDLLLCFILAIWVFSLICLGLWSTFEVFLLWCETGVQIHSFECEYIVVPATFLEEKYSFHNELHSHPC